MELVDVVIDIRKKSSRLESLKRIIDDVAFESGWDSLMRIFCRQSADILASVPTVYMSLSMLSLALPSPVREFMIHS